MATVVIDRKSGKVIHADEIVLSDEQIVEAGKILARMFVKLQGGQAAEALK